MRNFLTIESSILFYYPITGYSQNAPVVVTIVLSGQSDEIVQGPITVIELVISFHVLYRKTKDLHPLLSKQKWMRNTFTIALYCCTNQFRLR